MTSEVIYKPFVHDLKVRYVIINIYNFCIIERTAEESTDLESATQRKTHSPHLFWCIFDHLKNKLK